MYRISCVNVYLIICISMHSCFTGWPSRPYLYIAPPSPNHRPIHFRIQSGHAACCFSGFDSDLSNKEMPRSNSLILAVKREVSYTKTALAASESRPDVRPSSCTEFRGFHRLEVSEGHTDLRMVLGWIWLQTWILT